MHASRTDGWSEQGNHHVIVGKIDVAGVASYGLAACEQMGFNDTTRNVDSYGTCLLIVAHAG
jgi:hypothetical protein